MLQAIAAAKRKNDKIDASKIADCLRCDFLPESYMMPTEMRDRRRFASLPQRFDTEAIGADEEPHLRDADGNRSEL